MLHTFHPCDRVALTTTELPDGTLTDACYVLRQKDDRQDIRQSSKDRLRLGDIVHSKNDRQQGDIHKCEAT